MNRVPACGTNHFWEVAARSSCPCNNPFQLLSVLVTMLRFLWQIMLSIFSTSSPKQLFPGNDLHKVELNPYRAGYRKSSRHSYNECKSFKKALLNSSFSYSTLGSSPTRHYLFCFKAAWDSCVLWSQASE